MRCVCGNYTDERDGMCETCKLAEQVEKEYEDRYANRSDGGW